MSLLLALALSVSSVRAWAQPIDPNALLKQGAAASQDSSSQDQGSSDDNGADPPKPQTQMSVLMGLAGQPAGVELRTGAGSVLRVGVDGQALSSRPAAPEPPRRDWTPLGIAVCCALFGLSLLLRKDGPAPAAEPAAAPPLPGGEALGQLAIVRVIGEGGMGVVYEAMDRALDRRVALKKMREELQDKPADRQQFLAEAKTVAALHHANIVEIYSIVQQAGAVYLVFEYVDGKTAEHILRERGRLGLPHVKGILGPVCQALDFAHARGVVHRDLKPSNVMVTTAGEVKVMDFGIARRAKDVLEAGAPPERAGALGLTNTLRGTPLYMAPEAEAGVFSPAVDVFALGVMAYELAVGRPPFAPPASAAQKALREYVKPTQAAPGLPPDFDALVDAALSPEPAARPASAGRFFQALAALS